MKDAMQVADDILNLSREKQYNIGAFVHGQIFALEFTSIAYGVPAQQIAEIKRDCRRYITDMLQYQGQQVPAPQGDQAAEEKTGEKPVEQTAAKTKEEPAAKTEQKPAKKTDHKPAKKVEEKIE